MTATESGLSRRRTRAHAASLALGVQDRDLANLSATIRTILARAWADIPEHDPTLADLDVAAIRHDIAAWCGGHSGPGLACGLAEFWRLRPFIGTADLLLLGRLVSLHADYTILTPAFISNEAWVDRLHAAGRIITDAARGDDTPSPALKGELAFLSRVFTSLMS